MADSPAPRRSPIARLLDYGQSPWYDNLTRQLVESGGLRRLMDDDGIRGVTSNPTIFEKAMASGEGYDEQLAELARAGMETDAIYWELVLHDVAVIEPAQFVRCRGKIGMLGAVGLPCPLC